MSAYQTIIDVLEDVADEPREAAVEILNALRDAPPEVLAAGVSADQWEAACGAMISVANTMVGAEHAAEANGRRLYWPVMKEQFEQGGCEVSRLNDDVWRVEGPGVSLYVDLRIGEARHTDRGAGGQLPSFDEIVEHVVWRVRSRLATKADLARRKERRKTHRWDGAKQVWVPRNGIGPDLPAGQ